MNHTFKLFSLPLLALASLLVSCKGNTERPGAPATDTAAHSQAPPVPSADTVTWKPADSIPADCPWYTGTIDTLAVQMQLCRREDELYGRYRYRKVGTYIEVQGHVEPSGEFILYEWGNGPKRQTGQFLGRFTDNDAMTGDWVSATGKRTLKFSLQGPPGDSAAAAADTSKFSGEWRWEGEEGAVFTLSLRENGPALSGFHCSVTSNARRVDCRNPDDPVTEIKETIQGRVNGRNAAVTFQSTYGLDKKGDPVEGRARIIRSGDSLIWRIVGETTGEHWLPYNVTLKRDRNAPPRL